MKTRHIPEGLKLSRRGLIWVAGAGFLASPAAFAASPAADQVPPGVALARLAAGNARYVAGRAKHPHQDVARRAIVAAGQRPFATILTCADSRVAPELIFDQGLGDLFVVRVAGNVVDEAILASIEYSVIHLGAALIVVLGHGRCGAVEATAEALEGRGSEDDRETRIGALAGLIAPAVRAVPASASDPLEAAISLNAENGAAEIFAESPPLRARVLSCRLRIISARYDLDAGRVTLLNDLPKPLVARDAAVSWGG